MKLKTHPTWPVMTTYDADHLQRIALPLGGIGTGTVSLGGRGDLRDWEIMNRPAKGYRPDRRVLRRRRASRRAARQAPRRSKARSRPPPTRAGSAATSRTTACRTSGTPRSRPRIRSARCSSPIPTCPWTCGWRRSIRSSRPTPTRAASRWPCCDMCLSIRRTSAWPPRSVGSLPNFIGNDGKSGKTRRQREHTAARLMACAASSCPRRASTRRPSSGARSPWRRRPRATWCTGRRGFRRRPVGRRHPRFLGRFRRRRPA